MLAPVSSTSPTPLLRLLVTFGDFPGGLAKVGAVIWCLCVRDWRRVPFNLAGHSVRGVMRRAGKAGPLSARGGTGRRLTRRDSNYSTQAVSLWNKDQMTVGERRESEKRGKIFKGDRLVLYLLGNLINRCLMRYENTFRARNQRLFLSNVKMRFIMDYVKSFFWMVGF